jgi:radical SAM superfamily enzyme YgiQ (UPF0313 family)
MGKQIRASVAITEPTFHGYMVPLGYLYVVATLKAAGFQTSAIRTKTENEEDLEKLGNALDKAGTEFVVTGTSYKFHNNCPSSTIESALAVARTAKKRNPNATTLLVGPLNTAVYNLLLEEQAVDAVALGEPEGICRDAACALREGRPLEETPGLVLRGSSGAAFTGQGTCLSPDDLPFPDREEINFEDYIFHSHFSSRATEVLTSRGCPFNCSYCFGARTSRRNERNAGPPFSGSSPERVIEEIDLLYNRWGVRGIKFSDVEFCASTSRVEKICELLLPKGYKDLRWRAVTHAKSVNPKLLRLMRSAGCVNIYYGVESGDERMLRVMNKKATPEEIRETFRRTWAAGIKPEASFLLGVPGETEESAKTTIRFALSIKPFLATFHVFVPYPGIPMESQIEAITSESLDDWDVYQLRVGKSYCDMPAERLEALSKEAYRKFYLRAGKIAGLLYSLKEPAMRAYIFQLAAGRNEGGWLRKMLMGRKRLDVARKSD